ncbi:hypothetical protein ACUXMH_000737 [Ralstonia pickettii]|jgi:hypothetical protein
MNSRVILNGLRLFHNVTTAVSVITKTEKRTHFCEDFCHASQSDSTP